MSEDPQDSRDLQVLERVRCHADLVRALAEQFARADVSLREVQARADRAGGARIPRATCADMLAGRRFPKKAVMLAFLRACRVAEERIPAWERAWERVRLTRMTYGEGREADPLADASPVNQAISPRTPRAPDRAVTTGNPDQGVMTAALDRAMTTGSPDRGVTTRAPDQDWKARTLHQALVPAAATVLVTVVTWGVIVALPSVPQRGRPEEPGRVVDPGHVVTDDGRAFPRGGLSRFTVTVDPANTGVRLIRRLDVGVPLQHATITVNGAPAAEWRPLLGESTYKWRNQIVELPPHLTTGRRSLTIVNTSVSSSGFNEFHYRVEQKVDGVWSPADEVDIGREHPASEAAHDYRIIGQDWADTQTFAYPPRTEDWYVE